jgi:hypothetical protein
LGTEYEYALDHTPEGYAVPTLVRLSDASGPSAMADLLDTEAIRTTEPEPAAYAQLTTTDAESTAALPTAESLSVPPGSNPFWRIGYYSLGVFPRGRALGRLRELRTAEYWLREPESRHPDRMRVKRVGQSPRASEPAHGPGRPQRT